MNTIDGINNNPHNLPHFQPPAEFRKKKKRRYKRWVFLILILLAAGAAAFGGQILSKANSIFTGKTSIFQRFGQLIVSDDKPLQGEDTGTVNILLLGMGGPGHDGPLLTDTMIVASLNVTTKEVALVSIPRDYMVKLAGRGFSKVNAAYAYAEADEEGGGGPAAIAAAEQITGLDIPYFAAVDFKGFVRAVDTVGGLDVMVDNTFTDAEYPNYNNGYIPPITFREGQHHFDGETALIYARSRHGNNGEGSDFARSERQKKIMLAFKDEVTSLGVTNLGTLNSLLGDFTENFRTNLEPFELLRLGKLGQEIKGESVFSISLDPQSGVICDGSYDLATGRPAPARVAAPPAEPTVDEEGNVIEPAEPAELVDQPGVIRAYVVVPCAGKTAEDVHAYLTSAIGLANIGAEEAVIEVQNASGSGAQAQPWRDLADFGMDVEITTSRTTSDRTIVYDNTGGTKPKTLQYIKSNFLAVQSDLPFTQSTADFVVILGKDSLTR